MHPVLRALFAVASILATADLRDRFVMPGLMDAHTHLTTSACWRTWISS